MQTKHNESTLNRPDGERVLDAPFVLVNIEKYVQQIQEETAWEKNDRNSITVFKTQGLTVVVTSLHEGATIIDNTVDGIMTIQVLEGKVDCTIENNTMCLKQGQIIALHEGIRHSLKAKEKSTLLITNNQ